jgi:hypothetical protein
VRFLALAMLAVFVEGHETGMEVGVKWKSLLKRLKSARMEGDGIVLPGNRLCGR